VEEIERGAGQIFATDVVRALRKLAAAPERSVEQQMARPLSVVRGA
jgi:hypothetical protein